MSDIIVTAAPAASKAAPKPKYAPFDPAVRVSRAVDKARSEAGRLMAANKIKLDIIGKSGKKGMESLKGGASLPAEMPEKDKERLIELASVIGAHERFMALASKAGLLA